MATSSGRPTRRHWARGTATASGWTLALPEGSSLNLAPLQLIEVPVDVQVPAGLSAGASAAIVLNVTDGALNTSAGTTRLRIPSTDYAFSTTNLDFGAVPYRAHEAMLCRADTTRLRALGWRPAFGLESGLLETLRREGLA